MTRDDIIRMAREAGVLEPLGYDNPNMKNWRDDVVWRLERFANLVAAAELRRLHEVTLMLAESAEKALEALNSCSEYETHDGEWYDTYDNELVEKAALALRQALSKAKEQA